jgi:Ferritin-like
MKNIQQFVTAGISSLADLQAALQLAMQLEFSTIPPYLCAEWSINDDPDDVTDIIHSVVLQEMFHFAIAGNLLSAVGGTPQIAVASFVPSYPTQTLPGGIYQALPVDLKPLSLDQVKVFMQIETPEFAPIQVHSNVATPATIGAFYAAISSAFTTLQPTIDTSAKFLAMGEAGPITSITDAVAAIATITEEGEGTPASPDQPAAVGGDLAHYYRFQEIYLGKKIENVGGTWQTTTPVSMPTVYPFTKSTAQPDPSLAFNQAFVALLKGLEDCWTIGQPLDRNAMYNLQNLGGILIQQGIQPGFEWA